MMIMIMIFILNTILITMQHHSSNYTNNDNTTVSFQNFMFVFAAKTLAI